APPHDPGQVRVCLGVGPDRLQHAVAPARAKHVALELVATAFDRMDVRILEAREEEPAREIDDAGARTDVGGARGDRADRHDPLAADRDGLGAWPSEIDG